MATYLWTGASGDWSNPADWLAANAVPGPSDAAVIDAAGSYTVTLTTADAIGSVSLSDAGATLVLESGGTLAVSGSFAIQSGTLDIQNGGTLAIGGFLAVQTGTLLLEGGTIEGGSLSIGPGGTLVASPAPPYPTIASTLQNVTVLGGLTLDGGTVLLSGNTTIENSDGTGPGAITLNGSSLLTFAHNYTLYNLTLNGGYVTGVGTTVTVAKGGLVQGYGGFIYGPYPYLALHNEGTINANVKGQWLYMTEMPVVNDGLILASGGGNISINFPDPYAVVDAWSNGADGVISVTDGGTLQLGGRVTNLGLITAADSTVYFGDPVLGAPSFAQNAGQIIVSGGKLFLGGQYSPFPNQWTDSGLIATDGAAVYLQGTGSGMISASGTLSVLGGTLSGQTTLTDDGKIQLTGASVALSSLTIDTVGKLSGFGVIANPMANSGIIDASGGKLNLGGAVTGNGQLLIGGGAALELGGATAEAVIFEADLGTLLLDRAQDFSGTVAGMAKGDAIDLADLGFSGHPRITNVSGTGAVGTTTDVTISDASLSTTLHLLNQYASQYPTVPAAYALTPDHTSGSGSGTLFALASPHTA